MTAYDRLITGTRLKPSRFQRPDLTEEMLSDKIRIVNCTSFRRLQTKAQVFSLEENPAIRSRLTHTLEVAMYAEFLARLTFDQLLAHELIAADLRLPFSKALENSCLLHDIGNPPFGHLGEYAICKWFSKNEGRVKGLWKKSGIDESSTEAHISSFVHFDGNAQGLRVVLRLQWLDNAYGLNLTCTLLAAMVKYLGSALHKQKQFCGKLGFFESERPLVERVWDALGVPYKDGWLSRRHPLTFLMEAADDIAYGVSDIEDAIEKRLVTEASLFGEFLDAPLAGRRELKALTQEKHLDAAGRSHDARFIGFRLAATRYLIEKAASAYVTHHAAILDGALGQPLLRTDESSAMLLEFLRSYTSRHVFLAHEAATIELGGHQAIFDILQKFSCLLEPERRVFHDLVSGAYEGGSSWSYERRLASLLPQKQVLNYESQCDESPQNELIWRTHLLVDYVAGMTDEYAMKTARMLTGSATTIR